MIGPRRVLVTGAGRRIGAGLSIALAEAGWHVVLHYNQAASEAQTLCETLTAAGRTVELVQADLAKPDDIDKLMEQARSSGPLDAVINNASLFAYDDSDTISASEIDRHIGSQLRKLDPFERAYQELLALGDMLRAEGLDVPILDLGGGLGVDYEEDNTPDFDAYGQMVTRIFASRGYKLGFEPGRSIAADNGVFLTRTLFVKKGENKRFIIVDGAMNDLIRPTLYEAFHRIEPVGQPQPVIGLADIVGPVCETGDYLGQGRAMPAIAEGEILAVLSAGAYGAVMMSNYNTRPEAAEVMIHNEAIHVLRPRRNVEDLLKLEHNPFT